MPPWAWALIVMGSIAISSAMTVALAPRRPGTPGPAPTPTAPVITSSSITGTPEDGETLTANYTATGYPTPSPAFNWQASGSNLGVTTQTIDLDALAMGLTDGETISCEITATNSEGSDSDEPTIAFVGEEEPVGITTPVLSDSATSPQLAGDFEPHYSVDFVDAYPTGGGFGDTLLGRWGLSEAAAIAMTPDEVEIEEAWVLDGTSPFPDLDTFCAAQSIGDTIHYQVKVVGGAGRGDDPALESGWSNFRTLILADGVMNAPGLTDLTGQATETRVWSASFNVAGLGSGAYARLTGTGPIRVGGSTVYEPGEEVAVQNGASVEFGVDTDASDGITVDNVVSNRGVALETFSATTAGVSSDLAYVSAQNYPLAYSGASAVLAADFQGDNRVICILHSDAGSRTISSVTSSKGGTWTEQVANAAGVRLAIWTAPPASTGSENVTVTLSNTANYITLLAVRGMNLGSTTQSDTATRTAASSTDPKTFNNTLIVATDAVGLALVYGAAGSAIAANNGTLLHELAASVGRVGIIEYGPGTVTPSFNIGATNTGQGVAAAWPAP